MTSKPGLSYEDGAAVLFATLLERSSRMRLTDSKLTLVITCLF